MEAFKTILIITIITLVNYACTKNKVKPTEPAIDASNVSACDTANSFYSTKVAAIITNNCIGCHSATSSNGNLSTYTSLKPYAVNGELYKRLKGINGFAIMPTSGKLSDCNIAIINTWINNGYKNN